MHGNVVVYGPSVDRNLLNKTMLFSIDRLVIWTIKNLYSFDNTVIAYDTFLAYTTNFDEIG